MSDRSRHVYFRPVFYCIYVYVGLDLNHRSYVCTSCEIMNIKYTYKSNIIKSYLLKK